MNKLLAKIIGGALGFLCVCAALPGARTGAWPGFLLALCVMTALYMALRLLTRPLTLAFDILLLGIPRFLVEAAVVLGLAHALPSVELPGYWWALLAVIACNVGMHIGRNAAKDAARRD